jgi:hypothetical protein
VSDSVGIGTTSPVDGILDVEGATHINDFDVYLRGGSDRNHGIGYRTNLDGAFLYGYNGGALGVSDPDFNVLTWNYQGNVAVTANLDVDNAAANIGALTPGLTFGGGGEGVSSQRTTNGPNRFGIDFYTASIRRVSIINNGNVGIGTATPGNLLVVGGSGSPAYCNGSTWVNGSDRNSKESFAAINPRAVLEKVSALSITEWKYKVEADGTRHLGPMAQDFHAAFGLNGADDKHIATVDESGVALAAIQGLDAVVKEKDAKISALEDRVGQLERLVKQLAEKSTK